MKPNCARYASPRFGVLLLTLLATGTPCSSQPVQLTTQEDHKRTMDLLGIGSLRRGADGRNPEAPNAANYDESKANPYPKVPDALVLKNGRNVTSPSSWWKQRRPEIVEDFDREVFGRVPRRTPEVNWEVVSTVRENIGEVPVVTKTLVGHVDNSAYPDVKVDIQLTLTTPAAATGPVPVIMELSFGRRPRTANAPAAPAFPAPTWPGQVLAKGWGYAILVPTSIQPDNGQGLTSGIIGLVNKGRPRGVEDWGALRAWAWGASRALDYMETDGAVDAKRVGLEGHSRYGKAAAVAMAYDPRFAVAFLSSSGAGGVKLHRRNWGETVENVAAASEYHWMAGNYLKYAGPLTPNDLPVDSHELVALCAPRPVFISAGATNGDGWVDAKGMFLAGVGAGPVYRLLGKKDLGTTEFPAIETTLTDGDIGFRQHSGGHTPGPNWPVFLAFAERYFASAAARPRGITARMQDMIQTREVPGAVTLIATREGIKHWEAVGSADPSGTRPMQKDSIFWIASMTKPITGTAILMLQEEGKLSVDDPVSKHIPAFAELKTPSGKPANLTLKQLMTHTSGLAEATAEESKKALKLADLIPAYLSKPMQFEPGSKWQYCQSGINTLGRIIEVVSGQPFEQFLEKRLFGPLGMKDTTFYVRPNQVSRLVTPAKREDDGRLTAASVGLLLGKDPTSTDRYPAANGGLFSTAPDYARFARMILNGGTLNGRQYLKPESVRQMTGIQTGELKTGFTPGNAWGLTWCVVREPQGITAMLSPGTYGHGGAYGTQAWIDFSKGQVLILMIQRSNFANSDNSPVRLAFQQAAMGQ